MHALPEPARARTWVWQVLALFLAALTLLIASGPPVLRLWTTTDILLIVLLLAAEWLVLRRIYGQQASATDHRAGKVRTLWSALLVSALVLMVVSRTR
jgi:hypothetical protein